MTMTAVTALIWKICAIMRHWAFGIWMPSSARPARLALRLGRTALRSGAKTVRREADELGITFVQTHVPFYNFCHPQTGIIEDTEEIIRRAIVCTRQLGAHWTVAHPGTGLSRPALQAPGHGRRIFGIFFRAIWNLQRGRMWASA